MTFKKLALASAIAAAPTAGLAAMVELEDGVLSEVTGQDGIEIAINTNGNVIGANIYIHDKGGFTGAANDGAIVIDGFQMLAGNNNPITINIDAGDTAAAATSPTLNVNINLPTSGVTISTGAIRVANSGRDAGNFGITGVTGTIMNNMTIVIGNASLNIQLGNEQQTGALAGSDMIVFNGSVGGGITISGFRLSDAASGGGIGASVITIDDNGAGTNLTMNLDINATSAGLVIGVGFLGSATGMDINITNQYLGSTSAGTIGDISIVGLNMNGSTITISGK